MVTAHQLARAYDQAVSARWRGEVATADRFLRWLNTYWDETAVRFTTAPVEVSPLAAGGRGIDWYDTPPAIVGQVPGVAGGYRVPRDSKLPGVTARPATADEAAGHSTVASGNSSPAAGVTQHPDDGGVSWWDWTAGGAGDGLPVDG